MTRLDDLIAKFCPEGVPFLDFGETCNILDSQRKPVTKSDRNAGIYPYYGANGIQDYVEDFIFDGSFLLMGEDGSVINPDNSPILTWATGKIWVNNHAHILSEKEGFSLRYLFYFLQTVDVSSIVRGVPPKINQKNMREIKVAVPPLPVQEEIVRILDTFTALEAELEKELKARTKQYETYRDALLDFDPENPHPLRPTRLNNLIQTLCPDGVETGKIQEVCIRVCSGGTPTASRSENYGGDIPWLRTQEVDYRDIWDTEIRISDVGFANSSASWIPENCVIVAMYGASAARVAINKIPLTTNQACCNLEIDQEKANYRYVYHWLSSQYENLKSLSEGAQPNLNAGKVKNYPIPIPPLPVQEEIVAILDRFDALVNDLKNGLPAEIAARRKQYEYYRNQLLTFNPLP